LDTMACPRGRRGSTLRVASFRRPQYLWFMNNTYKVIGVILLVVGAVLIIVGVAASRSLADNFTRFFTGHFTQNTMWYIFGGIATALVGLLLTIGVFGRPRS
jgi:hypothetical protein